MTVPGMVLEEPSLDPVGQMIEVLRTTAENRPGGGARLLEWDFVGWEESPLLLVYNGGKEEQFSEVTSARLWLNGHLVFDRASFEKHVEVLEEILLDPGSNSLKAEIQGESDAGLELELFLERPSGVSVISEIDFLEIAGQGADEGRTHRWLEGNGYTWRAAALHRTEGGESTLAAAYTDDRGRLAVLGSTESAVFQLRPFVIADDGAQVYVLQQGAGLEIAPLTGEAFTLGNEDVQRVMRSSSFSPQQTADLPAAGATRTALLQAREAMPDPPRSVRSETCRGELMQRLGCVGKVVAVTRSGCLACAESMLMLASGSPAVSESTPLAAAIWLSVAATPGFSAACDTCRGAVLEDCPERAGGACVGSSDCVQDSQCDPLSSLCTVTASRNLGDLCTPSDPCLDEYTQSIGFCNASFACEPLLTSDGSPLGTPCPSFPCRVCKNSEGGCAPERDVDGRQCTVESEESRSLGVCEDGECVLAETGCPCFSQADLESFVPDGCTNEALGVSSSTAIFRRTPRVYADSHGEGARCAFYDGRLNPPTLIDLPSVGTLSAEQTAACNGMIVGRALEFGLDCQ